MAINIEVAKKAVAEVYVAAFGRVPEKEGLEYWAPLYANGTLTIDEITEYFTQSEEYQATYPSTMTDAEYVGAIYANVFNRPADAEGLAFWVNHLDAGNLTYGTIMEAMLQAAHTNGSADGERLDNIAEYGVYCAENFTNEQNAAASEQIANITADPDSVESAIEEVEQGGGVPGETFTLTKAESKEIINGTAESDLYDATELGSLQDDDIIMDPSTTDNDVLNALVNNSTTKSRIQNVETLNFTGKFVEVGFDLTNTLNAKTVNLKTEIGGGTASILGANTLNAQKIVAGQNISTLNVTSLASGTRDTVEVNAGEASNVKITGVAAGVDSYDVTLAENTAVELNTFASVGDNATLRLAGGKENSLVTSASGTDNDTASITIDASKENAVIDLSNDGDHVAKSIKITGSKNVVLKTDNLTSLEGDGTFGSGNESITNQGAGEATIRLTGTIAAGSGNFETADIDYVELGKGAALGGAVKVTVNENATMRLAGNLAGSGLTVQVDNGSTTKKLGSGAAAEGTAMVELAESNATANSTLNTDDKVKTLFLTAKHDEAKDLDKDANGFDESHLKLDKITTNVATTAIVLSGNEKLEVGTINFDALGAGTGNGKFALSASNLNGDLIIADLFAGFATSGSGDEVTFEAAKGYTEATIGSGGTGNKFDVRLNGDSSKITLGSNVLDGSKVTATKGKNTIVSKDGTAASSDITIKLADGNDTVTAKKYNTITLGGGNDTVIAGTGATDGTTIVKDFVKGTDTLRLTGTATDDVDLTAVGYSGGALKVNGSGDWLITLENNGSKLTDTNLADSIQLVMTAADSTSIKAGSKSDTITVGSSSTGGVTITTGDGDDTIVMNSATGANNGAEVHVTDFTKGSDKIVLVGAIQNDNDVDLNNVTRDAGGYYSIGTAGSGEHKFKLENGGNDISTQGKLIDIVKLGQSATNTFNVGTISGSGTIEVTGGNENDFVKLTSANPVGSGDIATFNFSNDGGVDTVVFGSTGTLDGREAVSFNLLDNINTNVGGAGANKHDFNGGAAGGSKIGDASDKAVYVFADSSNGAGGAKIDTMVTHTANGYTKEVILDQVAAFIEAGLKTSTGETYVVIINDQSTATYKTKDWGGSNSYNYDAYAYLVTGNDSGLTATDIKLIGMLDDGNGTAGNITFDKAVIA